MNCLGETKTPKNFGGMNLQGFAHHKHSPVLTRAFGEGLVLGQKPETKLLN